MNNDERSVSATITGDVSGQIAVGSNIQQARDVGNTEAMVTSEELAELRAMFAEARVQAALQLPKRQQPAAAERLDELEEAVTGDDPDRTTTVQYVKQWFTRKAPALAGVVASILVNPIVGKLVQSAGDVALAELQDSVG